MTTEGKSKNNGSSKYSIAIVCFICGLIFGGVSVGLYYSQSQTATMTSDDSSEFGDGYSLEDAKMNDVMEWLAKRGGLQYWHNQQLEDEKYLVTGVMNSLTKPRHEIEELALGFNLYVQTKDDTLYILTPEQYSTWNEQAE